MGNWLPLRRDTLPVFKSLGLLVLIIKTKIAAASPGPSEYEIRTYMPFSYPVDPAKIHTIPEMNIAYALTSTLVEWDDQKELSSGLAESWKIVATNVYRFKLKSNAQWSDGSPITAVDIKRSLDRGLRTHPIDMQGLLLTLDRIACPSTTEIDFILKAPAKKSGLLRRLTEPKFGIIKVGKNGKPDLSISTGAFRLLKSSSDKELRLVRNPKFGSKPEHPMADTINIRKMPLEMDTQTVLLSDPWPNFIESLSLRKPGLLQKYLKLGFNTWKAPLDKVFYFQLGKGSSNSEGRALLRFLREKLDRQTLLNGMTGFSEGSQIFPRGFELHDSMFSCSESDTPKLPETFRKRPIEILMSPTRMSLLLKENLRIVLKNLTGLDPRFVSVPLELVAKYRNDGNFDLYGGSLGIADPNPDTLLEFYLDGDTPLIYAGPKLKRELADIKKLGDDSLKASRIRKLFKKALCDGSLLPLFHLSTVGITRHEISLSGLSPADECVRLSKLRFKSSAPTNGGSK